MTEQSYKLFTPSRIYPASGTNPEKRKRVVLVWSSPAARYHHIDPQLMTPSGLWEALDLHRPRICSVPGGCSMSLWIRLQLDYDTRSSETSPFRKVYDSSCIYHELHGKSWALRSCDCRGCWVGLVVHLPLKMASQRPLLFTLQKYQTLYIPFNMFLIVWSILTHVHLSLIHKASELS